VSLPGGAPRSPDAAQPRDLPLDAFYRLIHHDHTSSTNDDAKRMATEGAAEGTLIWADSQDAGRGRRGRRWESPKGNLYCSIILRPPVPLAQAGQVGFAAALAIAETASQLLPAGISVQCKWPNDVLIDGRKTAGLLLETETRADNTIDWLVLGLGINIASHPDKVEFPATSLSAMGARSDVTTVLTLFCRRFQGWYEIWRAEGFAPLRDAWLARAAGLGRPVTVRLDDRTLTGNFGGLDGDGALLLHSAGLGADKPQRITAGDVFFPNSSAAARARVG
jgi:BirA family transcriptional regulator, biotin operon repressor / biotin---[acetyl-CoA-carboxylase] ligase